MSQQQHKRAFGRQSARPQPHLRHVQTAVHEALVECQKEGKAQTYHDLKCRAIQLWEERFSKKLTQWDVIHTLPLTEPANQRKLPPYASRLLENSLYAFDNDTWSQALLLTHDSRVLFVVQTVQALLQHQPGMTFFQLTEALLQQIEHYLQNSQTDTDTTAEVSEPVYLHFCKTHELDTGDDKTNDGWTTVQSRKKRQQYETVELTFPNLAWFYAYKIYAFPLWMTLNRTDFHEAADWKNLSDSERHHNRILDHVKSVTTVQSELLQLHLQQNEVDYKQPLEWKAVNETSE